MWAVPHCRAGGRGGGGLERKRPLDCYSTSQEPTIAQELTFAEEVIRRELGPSKNQLYKQVTTHCIVDNIGLQNAQYLCKMAAAECFYLPHDYSPLRDELVVLEDDGTPSSRRGIRQAWKVCYVQNMNNGY